MPWLLQIHKAITADNCLWRYPGIPEIKLFGLIEYALGNTKFNFSNVPQLHPELIGSVRIDAHDVAEVFSDNELFSTPGAFFYDYDDGVIRINIAKYDNDVAVEGFQPPTGQRIAIGIIVGFCDTVDYAREDKSVYSGIFHDPRIKSLPTLASKMDDLDYGFQAFNDWAIPLIGVDGEFEGTDHTGCITKLIWIPEGGELSGGKTAASGRVQKTTDGDDFNISVGDIRRNFENTASCGRFSKDDFPYLDNDDVDKIIPMYWNKQTGIEPICLNKTEDLSDSPTALVKYCIGATPDSSHSIKRVDRVYTVGSTGSMTVWSVVFGTSYSVKIRRSGGEKATLSIMAGTTELIEGADFILSDMDDGFQSIRFLQGAHLPTVGVPVDISADSDDNGGADIDADVAAWSATLLDTTLGLAYVSIPASIAYDDTPIDIKVDLFAWHNQASGENEWLNGADIVKDAIVMLAGYSYDSNNFNVQSWEVERAKCADKGIHISPRIEDDVTISDILAKVSKSCLMLVTSRPEGTFDLKVDSMDVYPEWKIESYQRMETPSPSLDLSQAFSSIKIEYGTSGDNDKKLYLDTTYEKDIKAINAISKVKTIDTIISDEESAKQYAAMVYERVFDLATMKTRDLIEIKVTAEVYLINICPSKAFIAPRTRDGSLYAAYTVISASRALGDELITVTGRKRYNIEYDTEYTQGVLCDDFICDAAVIGATTIDAA